MSDWPRAFRAASGWAVVLCTVTGGALAESDELPDDPDRQAALVKLGGQGFALEKTRHFLMAYDGTESAAHALTARLERTHAAVYRFCELVGITTRRPAHRLEVLFFDKADNYRNYAEKIRFDSRGTYGVYHHPTNRSAFFNVANSPRMQRLRARRRDIEEQVEAMVRTLGSVRADQLVEIRYPNGQTERMTGAELGRTLETTRAKLHEIEIEENSYVRHINRSVIQHETAHQVLFNAGVHVQGAQNPTWFIEGLACLFETPPGPNGSGIAAINQVRLQDFRRAICGRGKLRRITTRDFLAAIREGSIPDPKELISENTLFEQRGSQAVVLYATSWALMHYLHRIKGTELAGYARDLSQRQPGQKVGPSEELALFEKHFGPLNDVFLRRWAGFIMAIPARKVAGY